MQRRTRGAHAGSAILCAFAVVAAGAVTRADLDVSLANGDRVRGTLLPAGERETFRFVVPEGARIRVSLRADRTLRRAGLTLFGAGGEIVGRTGRQVRLRDVADASGEFGAEVSSPDGVTTGSYRLGVRWRSLRRFTADVALGAMSNGELRFAADAGATVSFGVSARTSSPALPSLVGVVAPDGVFTALEPGAKGGYVVPATGTYTLRFENLADAAGDVAATAAIRPPRARVRLLSATTREIPAGATVVAAAVIDSRGGSVEAPSGGALDEARVDVPPGALTRAEIVVLGAIGDLTPPLPTRSTATTAAAFVGPSGVSFGGAARPVVEIPVQSAAGAPDGALLRVYGGLGGVPVEEVAGAAIDPDTSRVAFEAPRFTRFQAYLVEQPDLPEAFYVDLGTDYHDSAASIALGGGFAFLGTPFAAGPGGEEEAGLVRVFEPVGSIWVERTPIRATTPAAGERFGSHLVWRKSPSGPADDSLLVAAPTRDVPEKADVGAIDEFVRSGDAWTRRAEIPNPDTSYYAYGFGGSTVVEGDRLVAPQFGLRVYDRTPAAWTLADTVTTAGAWEELYGPATPVVLDAGTLAVGMISDHARYGSGHQAGSVYVYAASGGSYVPAGSVTDDDPAQRRVGFGTSVALGPEDLAVLFPRGEPQITLWRRSDLAPSGGIERPIDPNARGRSPVLSGPLLFAGERLYVGASSYAAGPPLAGVYVFRKSGGAWSLERTIDDSSHFSPDYRDQPLFGGALAIEGATLVQSIASYDYDSNLTTRAVAFHVLAE